MNPETEDVRTDREQIETKADEIQPSLIDTGLQSSTGKRKSIETRTVIRNFSVPFQSTSSTEIQGDDDVCI